MEKDLGLILNEIRTLLKKAVGNSGCDLFADTDPHVARIGKIGSLIVLEDATQIDTIIEVINGVETSFATTTKSYLNTDLSTNTLVVFDHPVSSITLGAGSVMVYYIDL